MRLNPKIGIQLKFLRFVYVDNDSSFFKEIDSFDDDDSTVDLRPHKAMFVVRGAVHIGPTPSIIQGIPSQLYFVNFGPFTHEIKNLHISAMAYYINTHDGERSVHGMCEPKCFKDRDLF